MQVKKVIQYGVILLLTTGLYHVCESQSKQPVPPTFLSFESYSLEDTLQWIKSQLSSAKLIHKKFGYYVSYSVVVATGCMLTFRKTKREIDRTAEGKPYEINNVYTVPLGRLKSVEWWIYNNEGDKRNAEWQIVLAVSPDTSIPDRWTYTLRSRDDGGQADGSADEKYVIITADNQPLASQLTNAFSHAKELCSGNKK